MILLLTGLPGAGKTLEAIQRLVDALRVPRHVYTNIDGLDDLECLEYISFCFNIPRPVLDEHLHYVKKSEVARFQDFVNPGSLCIWDEVHKIWNSRDFAKEENKQTANWCSEHRHHGVDIIFITQDKTKLDSQIRSLAQWNYVFRKLNMFGNFIKNTVQVFIHEGEGDSPPLAQTKKRYDERYYHCYRSYSTQGITEMGVMKAPNILNHWAVWSLIPVFACFLYFFSQSSLAHGKFMNYDIGSKTQPKVQAKQDMYTSLSTLKPHPVYEQPFSSVSSFRPVPKNDVHLKPAIDSFVNVTASTVYSGDQLIALGVLGQMWLIDACPYRFQQREDNEVFVFVPRSEYDRYKQDSPD